MFFVGIALDEETVTLATCAKTREQAEKSVKRQFPNLPYFVLHLGREANIKVEGTLMIAWLEKNGVKKEHAEQIVRDVGTTIMRDILGWSMPARRNPTK